jgi:hypothetical protein
VISRRREECGVTRWDLAALIAPVSLARFEADFRGAAPVHLPGKDDRFSRLFGWSALNEVLERSCVGYPTLRLLSRGKQISPARYCRPVEHYHHSEIVVDQLLGEFRRGATLLLESLDRLWSPVGDLSEQLERDLQDTVKVICFASWLPEPALDVHWDDGDVFVLQIAGAKGWKVYPDNRPHPLIRDMTQRDPPLGPPTAEFETTTGDLLYLPRGWWHAANTTKGPSLHMTFQVRCRTGIDLLAWLMDQLRDEAVFRKTLPFAGTPVERAAHSEQLRQTFAKYWTLEVVEAYAEDVAARARPRPTFGLPHIDADDFARALTPSTVVRAHIARSVTNVAEEGAVHRICVAERELTLSRDGWSVLELLLPGTPCRVGELFDAMRRSASSVTERQTRDLLGDLYAMGLLELIN